jgi:hypothetical protein
MYRAISNFNIHNFIIILCVFMGANVSAQSSEQCRIIRAAITDTALAQVGNYELSNQNDGKKINKYALSQGGKYGDAYCSWGTLYCYRQNFIKPKTDGRAVSWRYPLSSVIREYGRVVRNLAVRPGDLAVSYADGHSHVEIVLNYNTNDDFFYTVGFNTWSKFEHGKRRQGVWIHKRSKKRVIICNQLQFFWTNEKANSIRVANRLLQLHHARLSKSR